MVTQRMATVGTSLVLARRDMDLYPEWCAGMVGALRMATEGLAERTGGRPGLYRVKTVDGRAHRLTFWADVPLDVEQADQMLHRDLVSLGVKEPGDLTVQEGMEIDRCIWLRDPEQQFHPGVQQRGQALIDALVELERRQHEVYEQWQREFNV